MGRAGEKSRVEMQEKREEGAAEIITMDYRVGFRSLLGRKLS